MEFGEKILVGAGAIAFALIVALILGTFREVIRHDRELREHYSHCTFHGTRIEGGFNSHHVYIYRCGDVTEESETDYR